GVCEDSAHIGRRDMECYSAGRRERVVAGGGLKSRAQVSQAAAAHEKGGGLQLAALTRLGIFEKTRGEGRTKPDHVRSKRLRGRSQRLPDRSREGVQGYRAGIRHA